MMASLGPKMLDALRIAALPSGSDERMAAYWAAADRWSEKALRVAFDRLDRRGLIDYGVASVYGWLTDEGKTLLAEIEAQA